MNEPAAREPLDTDADTGVRPRDVGLVALGGMIGTLARHGLQTLVADPAGLPVGILVINVTGAFLLGLLIESLDLAGPDRGRRRELRLLLGTGLLGGYTTYSLLATDVAGFLIDRRIAEAIGYGLATIVIGGLASLAGILAARSRRARS